MCRSDGRKAISVSSDSFGKITLFEENTQSRISVCGGLRAFINPIALLRHTHAPYVLFWHNHDPIKVLPGAFVYTVMVLIFLVFLTSAE